MPWSALTHEGEVEPMTAAPPRCSMPACLRLALEDDPLARCWWCQPDQDDECDWHGAPSLQPREVTR